MLHIRQGTPSDVSNYRTGSPTRSSPSLHQVMLSRNVMRSLCTVGLLRQWQLLKDPDQNYAGTACQIRLNL